MNASKELLAIGFHVVALAWIMVLFPLGSALPEARAQTYVTITSPGAGATVSGTVTISTSESSDVSWVDVSIDGYPVASSYPTVSPVYSVSWNSASFANGSHTISAAGYNYNYAIIASDQISINVKNVTPTPTASPKPTATASPKPTATASAKPSATLKPTATPTLRPTPSPKPTATASVKPTATLKPTATPTPRPTPSAKPTATASAKPTATLKPTATPTHTHTPLPTATHTPTRTGTPTPTSTPTATPTGPTVAWYGCMYNEGGHSYQAVEFDLSGSGVLYAVLYYGSNCDFEVLDQISSGNPLGPGGYLWWFTDFPDMPDTSAVWTLGNQSSGCINYNTAPICP